ncbi:MAG TPA: hypothetical protein VN436_15500, partial [Holophaga sp.]|nr:hypothetical protein [Holophaga sp.]
ESGAGSASGFLDADYAAAGARIVAGPAEIFACPLVVKVKELQPAEYGLLQPGCLVAGYQQLARDPELLSAVLDRRITCLAYESVAKADGSRPMLTPMSTIAGLMSAQIAAWALQRREGALTGSGTLLMGLPEVPPGRVLVVGDGKVGQAAVRAFLMLGCDVTVLGQAPALLALIAKEHQGRSVGTLRTDLCSPEALADCIATSDAVVGAVAVQGRLAPKLITRAMLRTMKPGSVLVDIGIDMGGISETSRQTKLSEPLYVEEGVLHYCVPNVPALVPRAATLALTTATLPYVQLVADRGLEGALAAAPELASGLLVHQGGVVDPALAADTGRPCAPFPFQ